MPIRMENLDTTIHLIIRYGLYSRTSHEWSATFHPVVPDVRCILIRGVTAYRRGDATLDLEAATVHATYEMTVYEMTVPNTQCQDHLSTWLTDQGWRKED